MGSKALDAVPTAVGALHSVGYVARHPLVVFFGLAALFSWLLWSPLVTEAFGWTDGDPSPYWHLWGGLGPLLAALVVTGVSDGTAGLRASGRRIVDLSVGVRWLAAVVAFPMLLFSLAACAVRVLDGTWPDLGRFGESTEYARLPLLVYWAANVIFYGFGEEVGWRGFALPRLIPRFGVLTASTVLALFWATWHLPLFAFADGLQHLGAAGVVGWAMSIWAASFLFTWLALRSGGSIVVAALFHAGFDIAITSPGVDAVQTTMGAIVTLASLAALVALKRGTAGMPPARNRSDA